MVDRAGVAEVEPAWRTTTAQQHRGITRAAPRRAAAGAQRVEHRPAQVLDQQRTLRQRTLHGAQAHRLQPADADRGGMAQLGLQAIFFGLQRRHGAWVGPVGEELPRQGLLRDQAAQLG